MAASQDARARGYELEQEAVRYPDERGEILLEAADKWERAGEVDRAVALLEQVLTLGGDDAGFARHSLARIRFEQGADAGAWAQLHALEQDESSAVASAGLVAELLEERGEYEAALAWFDRAIGAEEAARISADPESAGLATAIPLFGRQRCREKLGLPVDDLDRAADAADRHRRELFSRLERASSRSSVVDPSARPSRVQMLVWQRDELQRAMQRWPEVFTQEDVEGHHAAVERWLQELTNEQHGGPITLISGSADGFADYLQRAGGDPAEESVRLGYSAQVLDIGRTISWPPGRNHPCWCGSTRKYKKCCGAPSRS
jgi:tetratricopeptide (TPR) repeat protein